MRKIETRDLVYWLLNNAGPEIRYRTLVDIVNEQDVGVVARALNGLLTSPLVEKWLDKLRPDFSLDAVHSSRPDAYENVMGRLVMLGMRAGLQPFDNKTLPFRVWLAEGLPPMSTHSVFLRTIVASFLSYAGYGSTTPVADVLIERLDALHSFASDPDFSSVFVDKSDYTGIPSGPSYQKAGLVNPDLEPDGQFVLPWIHDIRGILSCDRIMRDPVMRERAENIVEMVLSDPYQELPEGYGIGKFGPKYYKIGWSVRLSSPNSRPEGRDFARMLLDMEMLAPSRTARQSLWFKQSLQYLEDFQTEDGTYLLPRAWLSEKKVGYWVSGARMALGTDRRSETAIECESTFWVLRLKSLAGPSEPV